MLPGIIKDLDDAKIRTFSGFLTSSLIPFPVSLHSATNAGVGRVRKDVQRIPRGVLTSVQFVEPVKEKK